MATCDIPALALESKNLAAASNRRNGMPAISRSTLSGNTKAGDEHTVYERAKEGGVPDLASFKISEGKTEMKSANDAEEEKRLRQKIANVERAVSLGRLNRDGANEIIKDCRRKLFKLAGRNYDDPFERYCMEGLAVYEECLTAKNGRKTIASRTRKQINEHGLAETYRRQVTKPTEGFTTLIDFGFPEYTAEAIVLTFPEKFDVELVNLSRQRLIENGFHL
jgi:hypothetical protein